jgi:hypothetical protein
MRHSTVIAGTAAAALTLAGCYPPHPHSHRDEPLKAIASLDCPDSVGDLTRTAASSDGKSCAYTADGGAQVGLQLVAIDPADPKAALAPIEAQLKTEIPNAGAPAAAGAAAATGGSDKDRVDIDLPGIHIHANGSGDTGNAGVRINAGDHGAHVQVGDQTVARGGGEAMGSKGVSINAGDNGAEIRVNEPGSGLRYSFILASDTAGPNGYKFVGYETRGPASGPLVVAAIRAKSDEHEDLYHDVHKLLARNVGG